MAKKGRKVSAAQLRQLKATASFVTLHVVSTKYKDVSTKDLEALSYSHFHGNPDKNIESQIDFMMKGEGVYASMVEPSGF